MNIKNSNETGGLVNVTVMHNKMKISCPSCGSKEFTLIQKFEASLASPLICNNCKQPCIRPFVLSMFSLFVLFAISEINREYFWLGVFVFLLTVILELILFELEPLSKQAVRNYTKRAAGLIVIFTLAVIVWLSGPLLFGKVFLP